MNYTKDEIIAAIALRTQLDNQARLDALNSKSLQELQDMLANINAGDATAAVTTPPAAVGN